ncbi:MAG: TRAP transporter fused permease subunit [Treponema sp.]|nr:TRAP transporter fused permease subunit [Treponema sp.]
MKTRPATYEQFVRYVILAVSLFAIALHIGNYTLFTLPSIQFYAYHVMTGLVLIFLYYPLTGKKVVANKTIRIAARIIDWLIIALVIGISLYVIIDFENYAQDMQNNVITTQIFIFGIILSLIVLESARRVLGKTLPIIAIITILYALYGNYIPGLFGHRGYSLRRIALALFSDRGIYGVPTGTCAANVYLFLIFAAYLNASGASVIFQNLALSLAGKKRGGPAKMAIVASAFFGTISGSCVANVVSTGAFTIPLMKRNGYPAATAGAVEAVASTGGQIMPPVMGAAAFILADIAGIPYSLVCIGAIIPALMYYICLFKMVDLEAVRYNLAGLNQEELKNIRSSFLQSLKLLIPLAVLLILLLGVGTTPMVAAIYATVAVIICGILDPHDRLTATRILEGAVASGRSLCSVLSACVTSGIIVGIFSLTGLGLKFSNCIVQLGSSSLLLSLVLSMLVCAVLGMGLPTTAAYIVCATAIAPALINLQVPVFSAHLFLLFFASISAITPPVAVASYAAASIADENPIKVSATAFKLGITGFILPFAFVLNPDYLHIGFDVTTVMTILSAITVSLSLAVAIQGYIERKLRLPLRVLFFFIAATAITSYTIPSLLAVITFCILYGTQSMQLPYKGRSN